MTRRNHLTGKYALRSAGGAPVEGRGIVDITPAITPGSLSGPGGPSEESLSREIEARHGCDWRYDVRVGRWLHFDGVRWAPDDLNSLFHLVGEHLRAATEGKPSLSKASVARGVLDFLKAHPRLALPHDMFDADPLLLGTPGGVVDLRTGEMRPAERGDYITRNTSVAPKWTKPKRWLEFLSDATGGDVRLMTYLQVVCGYCLSGSTIEHALFFLFGNGENGKSVFLNTLSRVLGDYAISASMDTFTASKGDRHPTDLARLDGARLVTASETEEGRAWAESRIKQVTGGDRISARYMRQDFFEYTPRFKLVIAGNFQPQLHSVDEAMRRRFHMIPFVHTPSRPDPHLEEKLVAEPSQILGWAIRGVRIWASKGLERPDALVDASDCYFEDQDLFAHWLTDRCVVKPSAQGRASDLFNSWREFARQNGEEPGTQKAMAGALRKRGFQNMRGSGGVRRWRGVDVSDLFEGSDR